MKARLIRVLENHPGILTLWAGLAAFLAYFSMYMYRKPFTAGTYENFDLWGMEYKSILVIAQVIGYALSKFIGIRLISHMKKEQRWFAYLLCIGVSEWSLCLFALFPHPFGWIFLLVSALPLGLIWGIVFQYLEGRKATEVLTVIVSANFILTSGVAKSLGKWCMSVGISETIMPSFIGLCMVPVCLLAIWMLERVPLPTMDDKELRNERVSMGKENRKVVFNQFWRLMILFSFMYLVLTVVRDIRDNFGIEIWRELGYGEAIRLYTYSEIPVTLAVLLSLGMLFMIRDNSKALTVQFGMILVCIILFLCITIGYSVGIIGAASWMILSGIGLFVPYILFNGMIFERLIAAFKVDANVGFFMYQVDTVGYIFSVGIIIWKTMGIKSFTWLDFYLMICIVGGMALLLTIVPMWAELNRLRNISFKQNIN